MISAIAILLGVSLGVFVPIDLPVGLQQYTAIGIAAALDSVFGGALAHMENKFNNKMFYSGFFFNTLLAVIFTMLGDRLGVNLMFAAIVVFGTRIFNNLSRMRWIWLEGIERRRRVKLMSVEREEE